MAVYYPNNGGNMQNLYQESIYLTEQQQQQASSSSAASFISGNVNGGGEIPRNEMMFIPPNGDLNGNVTVSSNDLSFHGQGLSLSLGNQIQYQQYHQNISNQLGFNNQNHTSLSCNVDEIGKSKEMLLEQSQVVHHHQQQQQINNHSNASVGFYNNNYRYENSGFVSSVLRSRYLKPTQQLLDEVVNVRRDLKQGVKKIKGDDQFRNDVDQDLVSDDSVKAVELSSSERQELQSKKNKLLTMVDEVDKRYNQYYHQMEALASSFELVTGLGAAKPYTSVALNRISRHFRCLRDAIKGQIQLIKTKLGEKESSDEQGGERIPRLRYLDQRLRQQRALHQQLGMVRPAWRPQRGLPENSVSILRAWLFEHFLHPYPKESEKILLAKQTGLSKNQVANWFINARVRLWKPMIEEMYKEEFGETELVSSKSCQETNNTTETSSSHPKHEETSQNLTYSSVEQNLVFSEPKQARVLQGEEVDDEQPQEMMNRTSTSTDYDNLMNYHGFGLDDYRYIGLGNQQDSRFSNPHQLHDFVV